MSSLNLCNSKLKFLLLVLFGVALSQSVFADFEVSLDGEAETEYELEVAAEYTFVLNTISAVAPSGSAATWQLLDGFGNVETNVTYSLSATGSVNTIRFHQILISPTYFGNKSNTYTLQITELTTVKNITIKLLDIGGLISKYLLVEYYKFDPVTSTYVEIFSLDLIKGESVTDGDLVRMEMSLPDASHTSLERLSKITVGVRNPDGSFIGGSVSDNVPPLISLSISGTQDAGGYSPDKIANGDIPTANLAANENNRKDFVLFPYRSLPESFRIDTLDFNNNNADSLGDLDNYTTGPINYGKTLLDPRFAYDNLRNKLFFNDGINDLTFQTNLVPPMTAAILAQAATTSMLTNSTLVDIDSNGADTVYDFRPVVTPSSSATVGTASNIFPDRFDSPITGSSGIFLFRIKALAHGGVGPLDLSMRYFLTDVASTAVDESLAIAHTENFRINTVTKFPSMSIDNFYVDGGTIGTTGSVTVVAGKDLNFRVIISNDEGLVDGRQIIPDFLTNSGAQEYITISVNDGNAIFNNIFQYRNFDEFVFDAMEFNSNPALFTGGAGAQLTTSPSILYNNIGTSSVFEHHGLRLNIQSFGGNNSNPLFNDLIYLNSVRDNVYLASTTGTFGAFSRYTIDSSTKIGLIWDSDIAPIAPRFMHSQARLYTKDAGLREGLPPDNKFHMNLFQNQRDGINQRAVTIVPRTVGTFDVKLSLWPSNGGTVPIAEETITINVVEENILITILDPAEATDNTGGSSTFIASTTTFGIKAIRSQDVIEIPDRRVSSVFDEIGFYEFNARFEGIGAGKDLLWDVTGRTAGEFDMDDIDYFDFGIGLFPDPFRVSYYYTNPNFSGFGIGGGQDKDGDFVAREGFGEVTGRPEPWYLLSNGRDDDGDGVVDDGVTFPTGRAESHSIRISTGVRSIYYQGGTLQRFYRFVPIETAVLTYQGNITALNGVTLTVPLLDNLETQLSVITNAMATAGVTGSTATIVAAITVARTDPILLLGTLVPGSVRQLNLLNNINIAVNAFIYNLIGKGGAVNSVTLGGGGPSHDFAPLPTAAGMNASLVTNSYNGNVVSLNRYTGNYTPFQLSMKRAKSMVWGLDFSCSLPKEVYFEFIHKLPWQNRTGNGGFIPLRFIPFNHNNNTSETISTSMWLKPSASVSDVKYTGPFIPFTKVPTFTNTTLAAISQPSTYQNFATIFDITGGIVVDETNFCSRLGNNYRPELLNTDTTNYAGLAGWVFTYNINTADVIEDGGPQEDLIWIVEDRVGAIVDLPDAIYTINNIATFDYTRDNEIIIPEEDHRWRPDDSNLEGVESWFRVNAIHEVIAMESYYIAQFGIDQAYDPEHHLIGVNAGLLPPKPPEYFISYNNPSPAFHEFSGSNSALRLLVPTEMLDYERIVDPPFLFFEDIDDNGLFDFAVDTVAVLPQSNPTPAASYSSLTHAFSYLIPLDTTKFWDNKYDDHFDYFIVTKLDTGFPDINTGPPPFSAASQPDGSAFRFGMKIEVFRPSGGTSYPTAYLNQKDFDGKLETGTQDNYFVVNVRANTNDVDLNIDIYQDTDHPLDANGFVVLIGGNDVIAMSGKDVNGGASVESRSPEELKAANFTTIIPRLKYGGSGTEFWPYTHPRNIELLNGDSSSPALFPLSAQGSSTISTVQLHLIHQAIIPSAQRVAGYDTAIERSIAWRNDVFAIVRPYEKDTNGSGICDAAEDINSDGSFTQDVVLLSFTPEKYPATHPNTTLAGKSYYQTDDFLNMADIRWAIVRNESGGHLSSETGYVPESGNADGKNYVTYYPGSLNGLDYIKGENIKTGRSLIAVVLVRNNVHTDGIDNDGDALLSNANITTIGSLMNLPSTDPRFGIKCILPSMTLSGLPEANMLVLASLNIDMADDSRFDGAGLLDPGYSLPGSEVVTNGASNSGNVSASVSASGTTETGVVTLVLTAQNYGLVASSSVAFGLTYTDPQLVVRAVPGSFTLLGTSDTLTFTYFSTTSTATTSVAIRFNPILGTIATGDTFTFSIFPNLDWDNDGYARRNEGGAPSNPENGYHGGLDIDLSWNNPRPFYAIKVLSDTVKSDFGSSYDGSYGKDFTFSTNLTTRETVGSGVWSGTADMHIDDLRYLGGPIYSTLVASPDPIGFPTPVAFLYNPAFRFYNAGFVINNTGVNVFTAQNLLIITENNYVTGTDIVATGGVDLIRLTEKSQGIMTGEWADNTGDRTWVYTSVEICGLGVHFTADAATRLVYDFDITTLPGDHSWYAAGVFELNHTITSYSRPGAGMLRIDVNSMPVPVLQINAADTSDTVALTFNDGERLQKVRVNFLAVRGFQPSRPDHNPNSNPEHSDLAPMSNDMLAGVSIWKDNKDPDGAITSTQDLINAVPTNRDPLVGSVGQFDALVDIIVDLDGYNSSGAYTDYDADYSKPVNQSPLTSFQTEDNVYFIDRDGSKSFTLGDDIYIDEGQVGLDNGDKIIYTQYGLGGTGIPYSLGEPLQSERLKYYDENLDGVYNNGEDIVYEYSNLNGTWELPVDTFIPVDKDSMKWRYDSENKLWYVILDLENDEEVPPEDVFTNLADYLHPDSAVLITPISGNVPPNFYLGSDFHICIRTSPTMDYLDSFMVEIPDFWKHTQSLSDFDDNAGVWFSTQPQTNTYPSLPGSGVISPIIVANMPVLISDEGADRPTKNRIGRNSKPFSLLGISMVNNNFNGLKLGNDLLKTVFGANSSTLNGPAFNNLRLTQIENNRKTVLEDVIVELFNKGEGSTGTISGDGEIVPGDFNPTVDLLALDRTNVGDDIFHSADETGIFKSGDTKILRLGSFFEDGRIKQDDLTLNKQGKHDSNIVFIDIDNDGFYDDNKDILVYDIDGLTSDNLPSGHRTFKFGDAILKRGFSNWDEEKDNPSQLTPNDVKTIIGRILTYPKDPKNKFWFEDDDDSGFFGNEVSASGVALYHDKSDGSPYDNGKFDSSISNNNEIISLDDVIYLQQIEYTGTTGQPQHQVRIRPAVFDISPTLLNSTLGVDGFANSSNTNVDHFITDFARTDDDTHGGTGFDFRNQTDDKLFDPFLDVNGNGIDDTNMMYIYNDDTSLPDHHPMRVPLYEDKVLPSYGDVNGFSFYGSFGYLRAPLDDGQSTLHHKASRAIEFNTGNYHFGPDFFIVIQTSEIATDGDDFRAGISSWGRDTAHTIGFIGLAARREVGVRGMGFDDRVEDFEPIGTGGGVNSAAPFLYPQPPLTGYTGSANGDTSNSRTYTKYLSSTIIVDGKPPLDVLTFEADTVDSTTSVELSDQISLQWTLEETDIDRAGVLIIRRKGLAPDLKLINDGQFYSGPEVTLEKGEERRLDIQGYLGFSTKTTLTQNVSGGTLIVPGISVLDTTISDASFASLPVPPSGGKCYLLIGANGTDKAEIVSYTAVGASLTIKRGELGTPAASHGANVSVTYYPSRPVTLNKLLEATVPVSGTTVVTLSVSTSAGGLAGYPKEGVVRIGSEFIKYDNITFGTSEDTMNISERGVDGSTISTHSAKNILHWAYHPSYSSDTIFVVSTSGFPNSGRLKIDNEELWYYSKTATSFKGTVRGIFADDNKKTDTIVSSHVSGNEVIDSLYKVIMNDKDLDGIGDFNNDGNDDGIHTAWIDDLYYGDDPSSYFYFIFTYDDVLNYSEGKFISINDIQLKLYNPGSVDETSVDADSIVFGNVNLGNTISLDGGDRIYIKVEGGTPTFVWSSTESAGLSTSTVPNGFDDGGESVRFILYQVPNEYALLDTDIIITVTDSSVRQQILSIKIHVENVTAEPPPGLFFSVKYEVESTGSKTAIENVSINILNGNTITFDAIEKDGEDPTLIVWSAGVSSFGGQVVLDTTDNTKLTYTANSAVGSIVGQDVLIVTNGTDTITLTINIIPEEDVVNACTPQGELRVSPGNDGSITASPGSKITFTAQDGTCAFNWTLVANNSGGGTVSKTSNTTATYTVGAEPRTVDIVEVSDGLTSKRIEIHVASSSSAKDGGGGCFIRKKSNNRD
ncbi:MAG: hypothetical protein COA79_18300 [Planctomycetota bacterium]|nr:MAG: hypothetical protein COA79_18300 [Planctomycetota bacterium]